jgi:hypothetical protein
VAKFIKPTLPKEYSDHVAIQALARGDADENQQKAALKCILNEFAGTYADPFDPAEPHITSFNCGRRAVGHAIVGTINMPTSVVRKAEDNLKKRNTPNPRKRGS